MSPPLIQNPPSATRQRWRSFCCPLHAIVGAFSPDRSTRPCASAGAAPAEPVSLGDITPKQRSSRCVLDTPATDGLYEQLAPDRALVFRNARVLTMRRDEVLDRHDVLVRNGVIEALQPTGLTLPPHAVTIDCTGKTLLPGLTEIHGHLTTSTWAAVLGPCIRGGGDGGAYQLPYDLMLFQLLAAGVTRLEIMAGCPDTLWMRDSVRAGQLAGPTMQVGSPMIDGAPVMQSPAMSYVVGDLEGGRRAGELIAELGYDFAKPYSNLPAEGYEGLMQVCERKGIRVMGHAPSQVGIEAAIRRGQQGIAHAGELFYNETGPQRTDPARLERLVRLMADSGTWLQATLVASQRLEWLGGRAPLVAPDLEHMNPLQRALWAEDSPMLAVVRGKPEIGKYIDDVFRLSCKAAAAARQAGVRVLTGTDFANPYIVEGQSLHEELGYLVEKSGFSPIEALQASTRLPAQYHGEGPADGLVAVGGAARLLVLDADPLADIHATRRIDTVLAGTFLLRRQARLDGLARVQRAFAAMPPAIVALPQMAAPGADA